MLVSGVIGCGLCAACLARDPVRCQSGPRIFGTGLDLAGGPAEFPPCLQRMRSPCPSRRESVSEQAVLLTDILPTGYLGAARSRDRPRFNGGGDRAGSGRPARPHLRPALWPCPHPGRGSEPERLARAEALGAEPVDVSAGDTIGRIAELTEGRGASSVIEAVGADATIAEAIWCASPGGTVSVIGVNADMALPIPMAVAFLRSLTIRVTLASVPQTWDALVPLVASGRLMPEAVSTHHFGLSEAAEASRVFDGRQGGVMKVMLDPTT